MATRASYPRPRPPSALLARARPPRGPATTRWFGAMRGPERAARRARGWRSPRRGDRAGPRLVLGSAGGASDVPELSALLRSERERLSRGLCGLLAARPALRARPLLTQLFGRTRDGRRCWRATAAPVPRAGLRLARGRAPLRFYVGFDAARSRRDAARAPVLGDWPSALRPALAAARLPLRGGAPAGTPQGGCCWRERRAGAERDRVRVPRRERIDIPAAPWSGLLEPARGRPRAGGPSRAQEVVARVGHRWLREQATSGDARDFSGTKGRRRR